MTIHYFDNCATTPIDSDVLQQINEYQEHNFYNPSARSNHSLMVANNIANARERIAKHLGAEPREIYFTSGGTESDNIGIMGAIRAKGGNIVATASEHSAVYNTLMQLQNKGYEVRLAKVHHDGHIDVDDFISKIDENTLLACFMHVNNETGAINDVKEINRLIKNINARTLTFSDGVQAVGKVPVNLRSLGIDIYAMSGHKIHAGKGIGLLYIKNGVRLHPIVYGGGQELGMRSGTEYVGGIIGLATALEKAVSALSSNAKTFIDYKQQIRSSLANISDWRENCTDNCSPAIMSLAFADIKGEVLLRMLEDNDVIVGTGSACSSKNKQSRIAKVIELPQNYSEGLIRISFSRLTSQQDVHALIEALPDCVLRLRKTMLK